MESTPSELLPVAGRVLAKDVKEPKVLVGVVLGAELAKLGPRKRLQAALEEADHDGKNPELDRRAQEERSKQCDESVAGNANQDHRARAVLVSQAPVRDRRGERHELRDEKCQHQLRAVDA